MPGKTGLSCMVQHFKLKSCVFIPILNCLKFYFPSFAKKRKRWGYLANPKKFASGGLGDFSNKAK